MEAGGAKESILMHCGKRRKWRMKEERGAGGDGKQRNGGRRKKESKSPRMNGWLDVMVLFTRGHGL